MEKVEYEKFVFACEKIAHRIKNMKVENIYGIPRGGLVPAVYLSHLTKLPLVYAPNDHSLIVDDIADTGKTLSNYASKLVKATIYYHKQSIVEPDIWIYEKKDDWVLFPWETKESTKNPERNV